jgi:hypothetical protein
MKTKVSDNTAEGLALKLVRENKEGGTIFLSDFMAQLPGNTEKAEVIQVLKNHKDGTFVSGRHGHPTRWVYGPMRHEISQEETAVEATGVTRRSVRGKDTVQVKISIGTQEGTLTFNKLELMSDVLAA